MWVQEEVMHMGRVEDNKQQKKQSLMDTAFELYTSKGIARTSIADIVERAGMAKGTFYLYFRDKYDLQEKLIIHKAEQLFYHAMAHSGYQAVEGAAGKVIAITDDILSQMQQDPALLRFINKNLSWGIFRRAINRADVDYMALFQEIFGTAPGDQQKLEITVYTILELVGSTCHSVILDSDPVDLESYRPYLHRSIEAILASFEAM
jgi:AcrR family transcriptional regulator